MVIEESLERGWWLECDCLVELSAPGGAYLPMTWALGGEAEAKGGYGCRKPEEGRRVETSGEGTRQGLVILSTGALDHARIISQHVLFL